MSRSLVDQCLELAWSQWASIGVSGSGVLVPTHAVDLEAAIVFAPLLEDLDPRLYGEVLDWCIQFARDFTAVSRLRNCLKMFGGEHQSRFGRFAAIVNQRGKTKWPTFGEPTMKRSLVKSSGKSRLRLDRPTSVVLRSRKLFGICARADILVWFAQQPPSPPPTWTHASTLVGLGYTKRSISDALHDLGLGQILSASKFGNRIVYTLHKREPLREILGPLPKTPMSPWGPRLALAAALIESERRTRGKSMTTQAVEIRKELDRRRAQFARDSIVPPPDITSGEPWREIEPWMKAVLAP